MGIEVITEFLTKHTVRHRLYVFDDDGNLVNPTSALIEIYNPSGGTAVASTAMSNAATGIYEYYHHRGATASPMAAGQWTGEVDVIDGAGDTAIVTPKKISFKVK